MHSSVIVWTMAAVIRLLSAMAALLAGKAGVFQTGCEPVRYFSSHYGDLDQIYDPAVGSPDRWRGTYYNGDPPCVSNLYFDGETSDTDNPRASWGRYFPFALRGHGAFDPQRVRWAKLRLDVYYDPGFIRTDGGFRMISAPGCEFISGIGGEMMGSLNRTLRRNNKAVARWVAIVIDLKSGAISAHAVDDLGNSIAAEDYGVITFVNQAPCREVLWAASHGELWGVFVGGRVSYVSLEGEWVASEAATTAAPISVTSVKGEELVGGSEELARLDGNAMVAMAKRKDDFRVLEFDTTFALGPDTFARVQSISLDLAASGIAQGAKLRVLAQRADNQQFVQVGELEFPESRNDFASVCIPVAADFVDDAGNIVIRFRQATTIFSASSIIAPKPGVSVDLIRLRWWPIK